MAATNDTPTFSGTPTAGTAGALWVGPFDASHARVRLGAHAHHDLELLWFERGGGSHRIGDQAWEVRSGDAFLVPPGMVHDLADLGSQARGWALQFAPDALGNDESLLAWRANPLLDAFLAAELDPAVARIEVPREQRARWRDRFEAMARELDGEEPASRAALVAHLTLVVVDVARAMAVVPTVVREPADDMVAAVFAQIDARFAAGVTPGEVAAALGFTTGHLSTLVRRRTGRALQGWILERQMSEARRLLATTALSVQEVGERVGFADPAYFGRRFRRHHGVAPSAWRDAASSWPAGPDGTHDAPD